MMQLHVLDLILSHSRHLECKKVVVFPGYPLGLDLAMGLLQTKLDFYTKIPIPVATGLQGAKMS